VEEFATSDSALYHVVEAGTGNFIGEEDGRAGMFSSPAVVNDTVFRVWNSCGRSVILL
jgi:hypothetical protein